MAIREEQETVIVMNRGDVKRGFIVVSSTYPNDINRFREIFKGRIIEETVYAEDSVVFKIDAKCWSNKFKLSPTKGLGSSGRKLTGFAVSKKEEGRLNEERDND